MKRFVWVLLHTAMLSLWVTIAAPGAQATVINGDFSNTLTAWTHDGDVSAPGDEARIGDNDSIYYSLLFQAVALAPGSYRFEFDYLNSLSSVFDAASNFPDVAFASLYLTNDLTTLDIANGVFADVIPLFDLDYLGPYNIAAGASITSSSVKGGDWSHLSLQFANSYAYVVPAIELIDGNYFNNDSHVLIDNVRIAATPLSAPPTLALMMALMVASFLLNLVRKGKPRAVKA